MASKINANVTMMLHPEVMAAVKALLLACDKKGLPIIITQGYRTIAQQNAIKAAGNSSCSGNTYDSPHQWGVAVDFARGDGKGVYDNSDGFFRKVGKLAETLGFQWGGDWRTPDSPHLQYAKFFDSRETVQLLKSKYGVPNKFFATWGETPAKSSGASAKVAAPAKATPAATNYYPKYTGTSTSIVDALQSIKVDSGFNNRAKISVKNGIIKTAADYGDSRTNYNANVCMLNLLKIGKLKKA
ncbi:MAG: M15 family metallopeptidase [Oscillospiraceae bacterium]